MLVVERCWKTIWAVSTLWEAVYGGFNWPDDAEIRHCYLLLGAERQDQWQEDDFVPKRDICLMISTSTGQSHWNDKVAGGIGRQLTREGVDAWRQVVVASQRWNSWAHVAKTLQPECHAMTHETEAWRAHQTQD